MQCWLPLEQPSAIFLQCLVEVTLECQVMTSPFLLIMHVRGVRIVTLSMPAFLLTAVCSSVYLCCGTWNSKDTPLGSWSADRPAPLLNSSVRTLSVLSADERPVGQCVHCVNAQLVMQSGDQL